MIEDINILIIKHFKGETTSGEEVRLHEWRASSEDNRLHYRQMQRVWHVSYPLFDIQEIDMAAAEKNVLDKIMATRFSQDRFLWWGQKIAGVLFIPLLVLSIYLLRQNRDSSLQAYTPREVTSMPGTRTKISLPDGSEVWLNSDSHLKYATPFNTGERTVELSGEAFFRVKADLENPFKVILDGIVVVVTGTELNVESYAGDSTRIITLVNGKASILTSKQQEIPLLPNQQFVLNNHTNNYSLHAKDAYSYTQWKDGVLAFREETLENVFKRVGRTFHVEIDIMDPSLARHLYRATFADESLEQILDLISLSAPIYYKYTHPADTKKRVEVYMK